MNTKIASLFIIIVVIMSVGIAIFLLSGQDEPQIEEGIDTSIHSLMEEGDIPSLAAAILIS